MKGGYLASHAWNVSMTHITVVDYMFYGSGNKVGYIILFVCFGKVDWGLDIGAYVVLITCIGTVVCQ